MSGKRPPAPACRATADGFTLVELLVSLVLVGLVALLLAGGLRFGTRAWEAGNQRAELGSEIQLVQSFLRRQIEQALNPLSLTVRARSLDFQGTADSLRFRAPLMAHAAPGGFYQFAIERSDDRALSLSWRPLEGDDPAGGDGAPWRREILLEDVEQIAFSYLDSGGGALEPEWFDRWQNEPETPSLLRIRVSFVEGDERIWPDLLIAPRIEPF